MAENIAEVSPSAGPKKRSKQAGNQLPAKVKRVKPTETFEEKLKRSNQAEFLQFLKDEGSDLLGCSAGDFSDEEDSEAGDLEPMDTAEIDEKEKEHDESVASSEDEAEDGKQRAVTTSKKAVTLKMVHHWTKLLREKASMPVMLDLMSAFKAALQSTGQSEDSGSKFKVTGSEVFNTVVQACIQDLVPALLQHLNLPKSKDPNKPTLPSVSPRWKKVRLETKTYVADVVQLLGKVGSTEVTRSLLRHVLDLVIFSVGFPKLAKSLLKKLISVWSTSEDEKNRLLAFCSIHRLLRLTQSSLLDHGFKQMYTAYVSNTKFTSVTTLPMIQLMQRSLVETGQIDVNVTYRYAFIYVRQLAIHLRSAITVKKKETMQAVYNWQFIHSLSLWTQVISELHSSDSIRSLIYPVTQTIIGTIKLVPTAQFYPLRFLCVRDLNRLSSATGTFIPVLPFLTEVLEQMNFDRKVHGGSMKPFNFLCILKFSKAQLHDKAFRDGVIDQIYELMLDHLNIYAHTIGFPELALPALLQLRKFVKSCKVPAYTRKMKELITKITETSSTITERRRAAALNIQDLKAVAAWETKSREAGTPLGKFYATWRKLRDQQLKAETTAAQADTQQKDKTRKNKTSARSTKSDNSDFTAEELKRLAKSDSEDEEEEEEEQDGDSSDESDDSGDDDDDKAAVVTKSSKDIERDHSKENGESDDEDDIVESFTFSDDGSDADSDSSDQGDDDEEDED